MWVIARMGREILDGDARFALEDSKILFDISDLGITGYAADDWLMAERNLSIGLSDDRHLLAIFTIGNDDASADELVDGVRALGDWAGRRPRPAGRHAAAPGPGDRDGDDARGGLLRPDRARPAGPGCRAGRGRDGRALSARRSAHGARPADRGDPRRLPAAGQGGRAVLDGQQRQGARHPARGRLSRWTR